MGKNVRKSNVFGTFYKGLGVWVGFKELWKPGCHKQSGHREPSARSVRAVPVNAGPSLHVHRGLCTVRPTPLDVQSPLQAPSQRGGSVSFNKMGPKIQILSELDPRDLPQFKPQLGLGQCQQKKAILWTYRGPSARPAVFMSPAEG